MEILIFADLGIAHIENNQTHLSIHTSFHELYKQDYLLKNRKYGKLDDCAR